MNEPRTEMAISPEIEAELRRLCEAATSGPWHRRHEELRGGTYWVVDLGYEDTIDLHETENGEANTAFIDAAREWFLPLLDQIAADRVLITELEFARRTVERERFAYGALNHGLTNRIEALQAELAKLRTAVPAGPDPDTLRPGENDSLDTHQDKPFGAGGQESGR